MPEQISIFQFLTKSKTVKITEIPKNIKLKNNQLWCPYCNMPVIFQKDKRLNVKRCPICNITINDFWVKKINKIKG